MRFGKVRRPSGAVTVVMIEGDTAFPLSVSRHPTVRCLADLLALPNPCETARGLVDPAISPEPAAGLQYLAPIDRQEIWAAGVTYKRSKIARQEESAGAAQFYDKVYSADRPELFMKATPERVVHPGDPIRVRADSTWSVPEPELTLVVSADMRIVGYTVGNDVSARDIEGENPLYLPQAKIYAKSCALGPVITPLAAMKDLEQKEIRLVIRRENEVAYEGKTSLDMMARTPKSLVEWLGKENEFPHGVLLMTGTGIVPPDAFTLRPGDVVSITIDGIGTLTNPVGE
ncbi:fumarylacetoacetate hydrolase family protein [Limnoglobus roseus]|uniref:2-hydroxyhepta-2,4-diene-1,7-dioate isomerase n=1 Tax=Limnoglobus roseus TaxID=2598579 RepID=A0A5C1AQ38_9BACT|nr:fumarylacetoacetate hydrolase family protein [Limnoglobus roseus]QEL18978.1 2-hydroxyhepta-2,4-diene-1,7-dioate isomerase [Limnoglobus roseus]